MLDGFDVPPPEEESSNEQLPEFVPSLPGKLVSIGGLLERIIEQFNAEFDEMSERARAFETVTQRRAILREISEYVFAVESVRLSPSERARLLAMAYSEIFGYGGLDPYFEDERVTTIALEGAHKLSVRYGAGGELTPVPSVFDGQAHLRRTVLKMLRDADTEQRPEHPILELGLVVKGRRVRVSVVFPPLSAEISADVRLHPLQPVTLDDWQKAGVLTSDVATFLRALAASPHGFVVVGESESGKTTLLSALLSYLPNMTASVERAGELAMPEGAPRYLVRWAKGERSTVSFAECVRAALDAHPDCILLDEVRADEVEAIAPLLQYEVVPRQIWAFRGTADAKRLRSALSMVARLADRSQPEAMVTALYQRLPFVVALKRRRGSLALVEVAEWQYPPGEVYPDYVPLFQYDETQARLVKTRRMPQRTLAGLDEAFWRD